MVWKKIGVVGVDSAQLLICDPMYLKIQNSLQKDLTFREGMFNQINFDAGHEGAGVIFNSGYGDGVYEVWANIKKIKDWGERICEVRIKLI